MAGGGKGNGGARGWRQSRAWRTIRVVWIAFGILATTYMVLSFSAWGVEPATLESDDAVRVVERDGLVEFVPASGDAGRAGLLFIPGGIVDPDAYAPLLRAVAEAGHHVTLVRLPFLGRHAPSESSKRETVARARAVLSDSVERAWVVAGHSMGGHLAARVASHRPERMSALVLLGTTHPRDFSIADLPVPVVKVYGTRDGVAPLPRMRENAAMLPDSTTWIAIEGGNHSQFGYYGFQIGDSRATITREEQQRQVLAVLLDALAGP